MVCVSTRPYIQLLTRLSILNMAKFLNLITFAVFATFLAYECNAALFFYHTKPYWDRVRKEMTFFKISKLNMFVFKDALDQIGQMKVEIQKMKALSKEDYNWKTIYPFWYFSLH